MKKFILLFVLILSFSMIFGFVEEKVSISNGEYEIPAVIARPNGSNESISMVVLVHGFASQKDEVGDFYKRLAVSLAKKNIASIRFDFPGSGDSVVSFTKNSVAVQVRDTRTVLNWISKKPYVNNEKIAMVGFSLGGVVGSILAGNDSRISALALWSTPGDLALSEADFNEEYYPLAKKNGHVVVDLGWRTIDLGPEYFESRFNSFPLNEIRNYKNPLLVIAGEVDGMMPKSAREFIYNAGSLDAELKIIPGADHIYHVLSSDQTDSNYVINVTAEWLNKKVN